MSYLARQQQALLDALLAWPADVAINNIAACAIDPRARGLKAYQANGHMLAQRALPAVYPVVTQLLGEESFSGLARALWHAQPPVRGDIACWGDGLAAFLQTSEQLQDEPYLPDVARAEWALHQCAGAADRAADLSTLALLTTENPASLGILLAPGCAFVRSAWPIASILGAHLEGQPSLQEAGAQLRACVAQDVVVWRAGLKPRFRLALDGEVQALMALLREESLERALLMAPQLDFALWLPIAVQSGLLMSVQMSPRGRETSVA